VRYRRTPDTNFGNQRGTGNIMIPVPLFDSKFLIELTEAFAEAANRRHWEQRENKPLGGCQTRNNTQWQGCGRLPG